MLDDRKCQVIYRYVEVVEMLIQEEKMSFLEVGPLPSTMILI